MIYFVLLVNNTGQTRLSKYYRRVTEEDRGLFEAEVVRKCISRGDSQCCFVSHKDMTLVYRRYGSLFFILGVDVNENEMAVYEFIQCFVETLNDFFDKVSEIDLMFNIDKVYMILDEMVMDGKITETNRQRIFTPLTLLGQAKQ